MTSDCATEPIERTALQGELLPAIAEPADDLTADQMSLWSDEELGIEPEGDAERELYDRERVFVDLYTGKWRLNGTRAAREAGYANPHVAASRLLKRPIVRAAVFERLETLIGIVASRNALLYKLGALVNGDLGELARHLPDPDNIQLSDLADLPPEISATIKKIKVRNLQRSGGRRGEERENTVDLELHDPRAAAELIAKICRFMTDQVDVTSGGEKLPGGAIGPLEIVVRREPAAAVDPESSSG
jgi:hypothetical protein